MAAKNDTQPATVDIPLVEVASTTTSTATAALPAAQTLTVDGPQSHRPQPLQLRWEGVTHVVHVKTKSGGGFFRRGHTSVSSKTILDDVSGVANPGQLLSIMGPSGGGKTSILNVLAGRIKPAQGTVRLNGQPLPKNFNRIAAYVMQDDLLSEMLTPRELFRFAANMRLAHLSPGERHERVEYLIKTLGLAHCANTRVGKPLQRGLSGGERKRASIGYELVTNPSLVFLDEPTSGLDSFTALNVLELLKDLAAEGRTVICTIHQPSSEIFALFDRLLLLSGGRVVYSGKAMEAVNYFAEQGLPCPRYSNPSDFFMRILHNHSAQDKARVDALVTAYRARNGKAITNSKAGPDSLAKQDSSMLLGKALEVGAEEVLSEVDKPQKGPGAWKEMMYLSDRAFKSLVRNPVTLNARLAQNVLMAIISGIIFYQLGHDQRSIQDRTGALFFMVMSQVMSSTMSVVLTFPLERRLLVREQHSGMYKIWTYYIGRTSTDIALNFVFPLLFALIAYWFVGFANTARQFFTFYAALLLAVNAASSMGLALGSALPDAEVAVTITPIVLIPFVLFGGLFANLNNIGPWFSWLQWLSIFKYAFQALALNELTGMTFYCEPDEFVSAGPIKVCPITSGEQVLKNFGLDGQQLWFPFVLLLVMLVFFRLLGLFFLQWQTKRVLKRN